MHNSRKLNINSFLHCGGMGAPQELSLGHLQAIKQVFGQQQSQISKSSPAASEC